MHSVPKWIHILQCRYSLIMPDIHFLHGKSDKNLWPNTQDLCEVVGLLSIYSRPLLNMIDLQKPSSKSDPCFSQYIFSELFSFPEIYPYQQIAECCEIHNFIFQIQSVITKLQVHVPDILCSIRDENHLWKWNSIILGRVCS